ncbi:hypothetical protein SHVI106290_05275 [Shewanella violacea]|uniref:Uncharacterized protein n=2 Tax=Shewanella violacea TaxID=60217 RepID=D4ZMB9_SHEVD|nr:hypothetical protein SVI_2847 [Shewanella violacea DSS12]
MVEVELLLHLIIIINEQNMKFTLLALILSCWSVQSSELITFNPSTSIEMVNFSGYKITDFYITPDNRILTFDQDNSKFNDERFDVVVKTDIPKTKAFMYQVTLVKNISTCKPMSGSSAQKIENFMTLQLDGNAFTAPLNSVDVDSFQYSDNDNFLWDKRVLIMSSDTIDKRGLNCSGEVTLVIGLSL